MEKTTMKKSYLFLVFFLILLLISGCDELKSTNKNSSVSDGEFYMTVLEYGMEQKPSMSEFFASPNSLLRLKNMNQALHSEFEFTELCFQSLYYIGI